MQYDVMYDVIIWSIDVTRPDPRNTTTAVE